MKFLRSYCLHWYERRGFFFTRQINLRCGGPFREVDDGWRSGGFMSRVRSVIQTDGDFRISVHPHGDEIRFVCGFVEVA